MNEQSGGSAFPWTELRTDGSIHAQYFGMSLRDYFAAKALQGLLVAPKEGWPKELQAISSVSQAAYRMADAMLAERSKV